MSSSYPSLTSLRRGQDRPDSQTPSLSPTTGRECTPGYRFPFTPFPKGWYRVALSSDLKKGVTKRVKACGQDIVLFRGKDGQARGVHAYCPHLGADLSQGGVVVDNDIACPFHDWRFNGEGRCVSIPYCDKIPPKARMRSFHLREQDGLVFCWYHPDDAKPEYELTEGPFRANARWNKPLHFAWTIRMHIQEVAENAVDVTHFPRVHAYAETPEITELTYDKHSFVIDLVARRFGLKFVGDSSMRIRYTGLGVVNANVQSALSGKLKVEVGVFLTTTPIDDEHVEICMLVRHRKSRFPLFDLAMRPLMRREIRMDFEGDIPIWEAKRYYTRPALCRDDGPIAQLRKWARQFYPNSGLKLVSPGEATPAEGAPG